MTNKANPSEEDIRLLREIYQMGKLSASDYALEVGISKRPGITRRLIKLHNWGWLDSKKGEECGGGSKKVFYVLREEGRQAILGSTAEAVEFAKIVESMRTAK